MGDKLYNWGKVNGIREWRRLSFKNIKKYILLLNLSRIMVGVGYIGLRGIEIYGKSGNR